jgi:hypothetical protein
MASILLLVLVLVGLLGSLGLLSKTFRWAAVIAAAVGTLVILTGSLVLIVVTA